MHWLALKCSFIFQSPFAHFNLKDILPFVTNIDYNLIWQLCNKTWFLTWTLTLTIHLFLLEHSFILKYPAYEQNCGRDWPNDDSEYFPWNYRKCNFSACSFFPPMTSWNSFIYCIPTPPLLEAELLMDFLCVALGCVWHSKIPFPSGGWARPHGSRVGSGRVTELDTEASINSNSEFPIRDLLFSGGIFHLFRLTTA